MQARSYQTDALNAIRSYFSEGKKRVLLHLATGAGKTFTFCTMLKGAYEKRTPSIVVVRGVKLIEQASARLTAEGVPHGIYQGSNSRGNHHLIQVCSIDTLYRQRLAPPAKFLVIDEAHQTAGEGYKWFLEQYADAFILAVSATPHLQKGMRHIADEIVYPISIQELMLLGYLVTPKYYGCDTPDLTGVKIQHGDYNEKQLDVAMRKSAVRGNIPIHYKRYADGRPALMFCASVEHSCMLVAQLIAAGVPAVHIDASSSDSTRRNAIDDLTAGKIKVVSNVGILTTGFDCPPVSCIILARPTMSYNLHIQIIGRGTRPFPGKNDFIVLDHAGNVMKHGPIEDEQPAELDAKPKKKIERLAPMAKCSRCAFLYAPATAFCPECGEANLSAPNRTPKAIEGDLTQLFAENIDKFFERLKSIAKQRGYKKWWIFHQIKEKFGEKVAEEYRPKIFRLKQWTTETPTPDSSEKLSELLINAEIAVFGSTRPEQHLQDLAS